MKDMVCYLVGAGEFINNEIAPERGDLVIAVDGGYGYLKKTGTRADIVIGDFDSMPDKPVHPNVIELNKEKDDTDMLAALKEGLLKGYRVFHIYGGTGGRFDHTIANIQSLAYLADRSAQGYLFGKDYIITAVKNEVIEFDKSYSGYISVFSHSDRSKGVTIKGLKYGLENAELTSSFPIGVSNEFIGERSSISVKDGILIIAYPNKG